MTRVVPIPVACLALALGACTSAGAGSTTTSAGSSTPAGAPGHPAAGGGGSAPAQDSFTGAILAGIGAYSGAHGRVKIDLHPRGSGQARPTRVVVIGHCGPASQHCTELNGAITGTLTPAAPRVPDAGRGFNLAGTGRVSPLGHVTLRGSVSGTGFISHGHELMKITLSSRSGSVTVQAVSGPVNGFTTP